MSTKTSKTEKTEEKLTASQVFDLMVVRFAGKRKSTGIAFDGESDLTGEDRKDNRELIESVFTRENLPSRYDNTSKTLRVWVNIGKHVGLIEFRAHREPTTSRLWFDNLVFMLEDSSRYDQLVAKGVDRAMLHNEQKMIIKDRPSLIIDDKGQSFDSEKLSFVPSPYAPYIKLIVESCDKWQGYNTLTQSWESRA